MKKEIFSQEIIMSDEEEIDLELLRSAALATIGKKKEVKKEADDLETLRKNALTSRKIQKNLLEEAGEFEKLQPAERSNLIKLTPELTNDCLTSEDQSSLNVSSGIATKHNSVDNISSDSFLRSSSDSCSSDAESSSSSSDEEQGSSLTKIEDITEEDDLLNAIDQFLDEGVIMLEKADRPTREESGSSKKNKRPDEKSSKSKKVSKKRKRSQNNLKSASVAVANQAKVHDSAVEPPVKKKLLTDSKPWKKPLAENQQPLEKLINSNEPFWKSEDLPLQDNGKPGALSASVHSSDLSFLSNSDNASEEAESKATEQVPDDVTADSKREHKYIRINRRRLDQLQRDQNEANRVIMLEQSYDPNNIDVNDAFSRTERASTRPGDRNLPDLREKLKRRGLHRRSSANQNAAGNRVENSSNGDGDLPVAAKKIYVKPSIVHDSNGSPDSDAFSNNVRKQNERLIVTRKVDSGAYPPMKIRIDDSVDYDFKSFRVDSKYAGVDDDDDDIDGDDNDDIYSRKRSVVPYNPEESVSEKKRRLDVIKKKAEESLDARSLSDFSDDFDDFEIEEPDENLSAVKDNPSKTPLDPTVSESRRFISSSLRKSPEDEARLSDFDESPFVETKRLPRDSDAAESDESDDERAQVRSKVKLSKTNKLGRYRRVNQDRSSTRRSDTKSSFRRDRSDQSRRRVTPKRQLSPSRESSSFRRKRRINVAPVDEMALKRSVKDRLGTSRGEESRYSRERRRVDDKSLNRRKADREKDVDERILQIKRKNAEIKKRRKMIEMEEQQFRLKAS